jgi:anti-sigma factor RsiW
MRCEEARLLVSAFVDHELSDDEELAVSEHIESCSNCARLAEDYRRMGQHIAVGYRQAPAGLTEKIRASVARERLASLPSRSYVTMRRAAALIFCMGLSALATWYAIRSSQEQAYLEREILTAHVRSLVQDRPIQIASSDGHTVKPWFNGRIDFAPTVRDLTFAGFPLLGGRVEIIDGRRVAALVYKRRDHIINVFMWPTAEAAVRLARHTSIKGYSVLTWDNAGTTYWAVSDLNAGEMHDLQKLL